MLEFQKFSELLAKESGEIIKKYFRKDFSIDLKGDDSPVTIADKSAEEVMRELIMKQYPEHGILGEEFGAHNEDAEYTWILDPIDGTKSFVCGAPTFGTLIALKKNDVPILGVFNHPIYNEFMIGDNKVTKLNGEEVKVRECDKVEDAVLLTTDHLNIEEFQDIEKFEKLMRKAKLYRQWGDCYGYYLVASGYADIMIDPIMSPWDITALIPIIRGAGGIITDYHGGDPVKGESAIATAGSIHQQVVNILN